MRDLRPSKALVPVLLLGLLLTPLAVFAQNTVLRGTVRTEAGVAVRGALVAVPSLELTRVTNDYGQYRFEIPESQVNGQDVTIRVTSIGYQDAEITVTLRAGTIAQDITMSERAVQLDEVVVTGVMGNQSRRAQSAVVSNIDAAEVVEIAPITTVANLLQARTPGVMIRNNSGTTGTHSTIRLRGLSSMGGGGNSPLIFIDGIRVDGGSQMGGVGGQATSRLNDIRPEDIEDIEIVKGPAAATMYGSDASAGVINIITKSGRMGSGLTQALNVDYGQADPNFTPLDNYGRCSQGAIDRPSTYPACQGVAPGTVLRDNPLEREAPFRNGRYRNLQYSLSGGGEDWSIYASVGGTDDDGTLPNNEFNLLTSTARFSFFAHENLRVEASYKLSRINTQLPHNDNNIYGYLGGGFLGDPRTVGAPKDGWYASNRQALAISSIETVDQTWRILPTATLNFTPYDWFNNTLLIGGDLIRTREYQFWAKNDESWWDAAPMNGGQIEEDVDNEDRLTIDYRGNLTRDLTDDLRMDLTLGAQVLTFSGYEIGATGRGLITNSVRSVNAAAELSGGGQSSSASRDIGFLGQAQFGWRDRVFFKTGVRRDQSSAFGIDTAPFYSPQVGVSYVISEEDYFDNLTGFLPSGTISELVLRAGYGVTGSQPGSGARSTYNPATNQIAETGIAIGVRPDDTGNPRLRAEKSSEIELSFEAGLFQDRLGLMVLHYNRTGIDQILTQPVPASVGAEGARVNVGEMKTWGWEFEADARLLTTQNLALDLRGTFSTNNNEVTDLGNIPETTSLRVGFPLTGSWEYSIREIDLENNRVIVSDTLEYQGNSANYPGWEGTFGATAQLFQNIQLYGQFDYRGDYTIYDNTNQFRDRQFGQGGFAVLGACFWDDPTGQGDCTPSEEARRQYLGRFGPFVTEEGRNLSRNSVDGLYRQDGRFLRFREASVVYRLPTEFVEQYMRANGATLNLTMRNLGLWHNTTAFDPESDQFLTVPSDRRWTLGFNFQF